VRRCGQSRFSSENIDLSTQDNVRENGLLGGNTLYGTTFAGNGNNGTVFSLTLGTNVFTTLASFNGSNGSGPYGNLVLADNTLYGTTSAGGAYSGGTVFSIQLQTISAFATIPTQTYGVPPFAITLPTATSGLPVTVSQCSHT